MALWPRGSLGYTVSTDPARLDLDVIHGFLRTAYWSAGIPRAVVERAVAHSLCFGLYTGAGDQCGFARVVTDRAVFAHLADVFVLPGHRGQGLGAWLIERVLAHPELQGLRRWTLGTRDAHELYARFGFVSTRRSDARMEIDRSPHELWGGG